MTKKITGIYLITNLKNGAMYVGQSVDIHKRWYHEKRGDEKSYLAKAINKYGLESFSFEVLLECEKEELNFFEKEYITEYNTFLDTKHYNLREGGDSAFCVSDLTKERMSISAKARKASDDTKLKIGKASRERIRTPHSDATKEKISQAVKADIAINGQRVLSEASKKKIGDAHRGKVVSDDTKKKLSDINTGKNHSDDTKQKISEAGKGRPSGMLGKTQSAETKQKMSDSHKGKTFSDKTRERLSIAAKERWRRKRLLAESQTMIISVDGE